MNATTATAPHLFARDKTHGIKHLFPYGDSAHKIPVASLPDHPQFSAVLVACERCSTRHPARQMHPHPTGLECHTCRHGSTRDLVRDIARTQHDHEFYPTTNAIIAALIEDIRHVQSSQPAGRNFESMLDIGAGSGKVLLALQNAPEEPKETEDEWSRRLNFSALYAIEKSLPLLQAMPPHVRTIGTDFFEQSLLTKAIDITFSNPPYSIFEEWSVKAITETTSRALYLVLPQRWQDSQPIAEALRTADLAAHIVGEFTFQHEADRTARAQVHLIRITTPAPGPFPPGPPDESPREHARRRARWEAGRSRRVDPFARQFSQQFADLIAAFETPAKDEPEPGSTAPAQKFAALVPGEGYAPALVAMYRADLAHIERNYHAAAQFDPDLLREFDISPGKICDCLRQRLAGLRNLYWHELFNRLDKITDRLTAKTRAQLLHQLHQHTQVDFTLPNIEAVILWVLKNANQCLDAQLLDTYEHMIEKANVIAYKSNQRTFQQDGWRYNSSRDNWTHFKLDYRIVCQHIGGMKGSYWASDRGRLADSAATFLEDLRTIAGNLGFQRLPYEHRADQIPWTRGEAQEFTCLHAGKRETLFTVRAFDNGNLHLKLNQRFILALNVEHGRLRGWLKTPQDAAEELRDPSAAKHFRTHLQLPIPESPLALL